MTLLALTAGDTALIILAAFWGLLVLALCVVLLNTFRVLESTKMTIDTMREETVPLLREVKGSVERANRELDRVDTMLVSANDIVGPCREALGAGRAGRGEPPGQGDQPGRRACARASRRRRGRKRREARLLGRARPRRRRDRRDHRLPLDAQAGRSASRPQTIAREAKGGLMDLSKLVSESIQEGKRAMDEREAELRRESGLDEPNLGLGWMAGLAGLTHR